MDLVAVGRRGKGEPAGLVEALVPMEDAQARF